MNIHQNTLELTTKHLLLAKCTIISQTSLQDDNEQSA